MPVDFSINVISRSSEANQPIVNRATSLKKSLFLTHMKVLIIRFSSIGDIVLTTPIIRAVALQTNFEVHFLTKARFASVLHHNPHISKVYTIENKINEVLTYLKKEKYSYLIDLHKNLRSFRLRRTLGVPAYDFPKNNLEKWLLVNFKVNKLPNSHIVDRYFQAVTSLGVKKDEKGLDYFLGPENQVDIPGLPKEEGYLVFVLGAAHFTKQIPLTLFKKIISEIKQPILLVGGSDQRETGENLVQLFPRQVINYAGKLTIGQSAYLLSKARAVLTPDTGMMHIAAAFSRPTVVIWGNTTPVLGMYPYKTDHENLEVTDLSCRPCDKIGKKRCPKGHFKCMNHQSVTEILVALNKKMQRDLPN